MVVQTHISHKFPYLYVDLHPLSFYDFHTHDMVNNKGFHWSHRQPRK